MAVQVQAGGLDPEPVPSQPQACEGGDDDGDLAGGLAAAHRPQPGQPLTGELYPGRPVQLDAGQLVGLVPALLDQLGADAGPVGVQGRLHADDLPLAEQCTITCQTSTPQAPMSTP